MVLRPEDVNESQKNLVNPVNPAKKQSTKGTQLWLNELDLSV